MATPAVLLLIFNRADLVRAQIDALRPVAPKRLYVAADGPRSGNREDQKGCRLAREALGTIDWNCEVRTLFRSRNLGVKEAVSRAIDWFFDQEDEGIILEEDCLAHPDFFSYAAELLEKFRTDPRIFQISGTNFQPKPRSGGESYFLSRYCHVWGWATWKRAWSLYRRNLEGLEGFLARAGSSGFWQNFKERKYWTKILRSTFRGEVESWAYRWQYTVWAEGGFCVYPEANLVSNRGFGPGATNTKSRHSLKGDRPCPGMPQVVHPAMPVPIKQADLWTFRHLYWGSPWERFVHRLEKVPVLWDQVLRWVSRPAHLEADLPRPGIQISP